MDVKIKTAEPLIVDRNYITKKIAAYWNNLSEAWRTIWGPHIHHGYYEENESLTPLEAQERLIEKLATILAIQPQDQILDVGCGMGGSSIYLTKHYQAKVTGITLSQKQIEIATRTANENNITDINFKIEDALSLASIPDNSFDIVWSLESCEQFQNKKLFIQQAYRVLKPGGKLMIATWCSDREEYQGRFARQYQALCHGFDLPYMPTIKHYADLLAAQKLTDIKTYDWSTEVMKSWDIGLARIKLHSLFQLLKMGGWQGLRFIKQAKKMQTAFHLGHVRYGVLFASKT